MSDKIYNKNAREKALLEEAYSNVYTEEVPDRASGVGWRGEHNILDVNSTEDLEHAEEGDAFLLDKVAKFAKVKRSDVMKFLSQFGSWEVEPNPNGHIVIKISRETGLTDSGEPDPNRDGYNYI